MQKARLHTTLNKYLVILAATLAAGTISGCSTAPQQQQQAEQLPVLEVRQLAATSYQEFSSSIQGSRDIEIRPQVDGYLDQIYIDEGAHVKKGQALFRINDRTYREQLNQAKASLAAAKAHLATAQINLSRLAPLVDNNVVSDVQMKAAQAAYDAAAANVSQAEAMMRNAAINLDYTLIKAPADGYIGKIPFKTGSLVGVATAQALTVISEISTVHAYFSLSENEFLHFKETYPGGSIEEKIRNMPPVELVLADNSVYPQKGTVEMVSGQFDNSMGSISFRAVFPNTDGSLRSGNTGRIRIPQSLASVLVIPQEATYELQDKVFVFAVKDSNKVESMPVTVSGKSGNYYLVQKGIPAGTRIVYSGLDRLRDGAVIRPQPVSMDSLLLARPL